MDCEKYWYYRKLYAEVCDLIEEENQNIKIDKTKNAEIFVKKHLNDWRDYMNKEKCYKIIDRCKSEINEVVKECDGKDGNSAFLALELIKDMDRLKKCMSIDKIPTMLKE